MKLTTGFVKDSEKPHLQPQRSRSLEGINNESLR